MSDQGVLNGNGSGHHPIQPLQAPGFHQPPSICLSTDVTTNESTILHSPRIDVRKIFIKKRRFLTLIFNINFLTKDKNIWSVD